MVSRGEVKLDAPISQYLPSGVASPSQDGHQITLRELATHSSGLPRLPDDLLAKMKDPQNPYAGYSLDDLFQSLATVKLHSVPGKTSTYSNYGYGLLGQLLARKASTPYTALIQESVISPLALSSTTFHLSPEQKTRLAEGHDSKGNPVKNWEFDALAPAGALYSDAEDLVKFLQMNLSPSLSPLSQALIETQKNHFKTFTGGIGLGWQISRKVQGQVVRWHNGGTGGYVSFIGFDEKSKTAVVLLCSSGDAFVGDSSIDKMGFDLLEVGSKISWK